LQQLEKANAWVRQQQDRRQTDAWLDRYKRKVALFMRLRGVEQTGMESLIEAWARSLEITPRELRAQLAERIDPIQKWLTENGVLEEIERRKAAGTWPSG